MVCHVDPSTEPSRAQRPDLTGYFKLRQRRSSVYGAFTPYAVRTSTHDGTSRKHRRRRKRAPPQVAA